MKAGAEAGPGEERAGGGEAGHIDADLRHEDAGRSFADARHGNQVVDGGAKGGEGLSHARLHLAHGGFQGLDRGQMPREHEAVMGGHTAAQGGGEVSRRGCDALVGQGGQAVGIALARDEGPEDRAAADAQDIGGCG